MVIQRELSIGNIPAPQMIDGVMILLAGALLITPGLITDISGFLLLIPILIDVMRDEQALRRAVFVLIFSFMPGIDHLNLLAIRQPGMKIVRADLRHLAKWEPPERRKFHAGCCVEGMYSPLLTNDRWPSPSPS